LGNKKESVDYISGKKILLGSLDCGRKERKMTLAYYTKMEKN